MSAPDILLRIRGRREQRLQAEGPSFGVELPAERSVPLVPFGAEQFLIAEIKRKSPSAGSIAAGADPVRQAGLYAEEGVTHFSVLTEEEFFGGSLADLCAVKQALPHCAVLRKDFLLNKADVDTAYRAGADAVLLIAAMLSEQEAQELYGRAVELGLRVLVECHSAAEIEAVEGLGAGLYGINSRDLRSFRMDALQPAALRNLLPQGAQCVYESGIHGYEDALLAGVCGFHGVLVGEALMKRPAAAAEIMRGLAHGQAARVAGGRSAGPVSGNPDFWQLLAQRRSADGRPLVKICGITRADEARLAAELGADLLGFVFADSPRRALPELLRELQTPESLPGRPLKVAVVVDGVPPVVQQLLAEGLLDAVQLHGAEQPEECLPLGFPYYKALRLGGPAGAELLGRYRCPRVLIDAYTEGQAGGTGRRIAPELVEAAAVHKPLWLAGGLNPDNIAQIISTHRPELVDASSGLESAPGRKDHARLRRYFQEIQNATE